MLNDKYAIIFVFKGGERFDHNEYFRSQLLVEYDANKSIFNSALKYQKINKTRQKSGVNDKNSDAHNCYRN